MIPYNFHSHTKYSDGSNQPTDYIAEAIRQGFKGYGFSEHSVLPFENTFALRKDTEAQYCNEITRLKSEYSSQLDIWLSLEADYIPSISENFKGLKQRLGLDYVIGSVHLVKGNTHNDLVNNLWFIDGPKAEKYDNGLMQIFDGDVRKAITAYWHQLNMMIELEEFDIVGHMDKIKMHNNSRWFKEDEAWYLSLIDETIDLISQRDLMVEVNTRGLYKGRSETFFPGNGILKKLCERGVRVIISSDAHLPAEISLCFNEAIKALKDCGYSSSWIYTKSGWIERTLPAE